MAFRRVGDVVIKLLRPLRKHQEDFVARFSKEREGAALHEMGTGKTTSVICTMRTHFNQNQRFYRTLIITPKATLYNWRDEFALNALPSMVEKVFVIDGPGNKKKAKIESLMHQECVLLINPESLDSDKVFQALKEFSPEYFILDESQKFKNPQGKRFRKCLEISDQAQFRFIMTGTPILNNPMDVWAQWRIMDRGASLGDNFYSFRETYFEDKNARWKGKPNYFPDWQPRHGTALRLSRAMDLKASRVLKSQCLDLPPQVFTRRDVELAPDARRVYDRMFKELIAEVNGGVCTAPNALTKTLRLLQLASGYLQAEDGTPHFLPGEREEVLEDLLDELVSEHKVIIWAAFRPNYHVIEEILKRRKIGFARLYGGVPDVPEQIKKFQTDDKCRIMVANAQAGGIGVNLVEADYSIYYSRNFSLGDRLQSLARNHRGGSERHSSITVVDLVARDTIESDVLSSLTNKEEFASNVLQRLKGMRP